MKQYEQLALRIIIFSTEDVLTTSGPTLSSYSGGDFYVDDQFN